MDVKIRLGKWVIKLFIISLESFKLYLDLRTYCINLRFQFSTSFTTTLSGCKVTSRCWLYSRLLNRWRICRNWGAISTAATRIPGIVWGFRKVLRFTRLRMLSLWWYVSSCIGRWCTGRGTCCSWSGALLRCTRCIVFVLST